MTYQNYLLSKGLSINYLGAIVVPLSVDLPHFIPEIKSTDRRSEVRPHSLGRRATDKEQS